MNEMDRGPEVSVWALISSFTVSNSHFEIELSAVKILGYYLRDAFS
jgi:hypothetical protein